MRVNSLVVGVGEVGSAVKEVLSEVYEVYGLDLNTSITFDECDYLNICIPYSDRFVDIVNEYVDRFKPKLTVIHSTIPIGTTKKIKGNVVHSPVRGRHPKIVEGLKRYIKYVGYNDFESNLLAGEYLDKVFSTRFVQDSNVTEFMKLSSLAFYLVYLAVADEINELSKKLGVSFGEVKNWITTQNDEIDNFYTDMRWPVLDPPEGKVGGHCCLPVSEMLLGEAQDAGVDTKVILQAFKKYQNLQVL